LPVIGTIFVVVVTSFVLLISATSSYTYHYRGIRIGLV